MTIGSQHPVASAVNCSGGGMPASGNAVTTLVDSRSWQQHLLLQLLFEYTLS